MPADVVLLSYVLLSNTITGKGGLASIRFLVLSTTCDREQSVLLFLVNVCVELHNGGD